MVNVCFENSGGDRRSQHWSECLSVLDLNLNPYTRLQPDTPKTSRQQYKNGDAQLWKRDIYNISFFFFFTLTWSRINDWTTFVWNWNKFNDYTSRSRLPTGSGRPAVIAGVKPLCLGPWQLIVQSAVWQPETGGPPLSVLPLSAAATFSTGLDVRRESTQQLPSGGTSLLLHNLTEQQKQGWVFFFFYFFILFQSSV